MMGFLQPVNDAYDVLGAAVDSVGLQALEGPAGGLELLQGFFGDLLSFRGIFLVLLNLLSLWVTRRRVKIRAQTLKRSPVDNS